MKKFWVCWLLLLVSSGSRADASKTTAADLLQEKLQAVETFQADFEQKLTDPSGDVIQVTKGQVKVKKPGLFYWSVLPPYEQTVVANQQFLWVYDPDLEQVTVSDRHKLDNSPAQILSGDFSSLGDKYRVLNTHQGKSDTYTLEATAADVATFIKIVFVFDAKNVLQSMTLTDKLNQQTAVVLAHQKQNMPVLESTFEFEPPQGTDVIHN